MIGSYEKEVLLRIQQKIASNKTIEKGLLTALKFHDLNDTGFTDFEQFKAFTAKVGIQIYSISVLFKSNVGNQTDI